MASLVRTPFTTSPNFHGRTSLHYRLSSLPHHHHVPTSNFIRCNLVEKVKNLENGKPGMGMVSSFIDSKYMEKSINRNDTRLRIFSGTANPALAQEIACYMGLELGKIKIKHFADGEIYVQLQESVRGCDVYLVQPTCPPANENLMELLI